MSERPKKAPPWYMKMYVVDTSEGSGIREVEVTVVSVDGVGHVVGRDIFESPEDGLQALVDHLESTRESYERRVRDAETMVAGARKLLDACVKGGKP